jgi:hypothetical protein
MAGLKQSLVTGQSMVDKDYTPIADVANVSATYTQAEVQAIVDSHNALLAELRANGMIAQSE